MYQVPDSIHSVESERELGEAFTLWRRSLPNDIRMETVAQWTEDNVWILLLFAFSYRMECMFYRTLHKRYQGKDESLDNWAKQGLWSAMFQLDAVIGRVATHGVLKLLPLSLYVEILSFCIAECLNLLLTSTVLIVLQTSWLFMSKSL